MGGGGEGGGGSRGRKVKMNTWIHQALGFIK